MSDSPGYRLSPHAEADLEEIWLYTFNRWSLEQADSYQATLVKAFEGLVSGVKVGRPAEIRRGYFKYPVGSHMVFYRSSDEFIDIIRVLHQRMDVNQHF